MYTKLQTEQNWSSDPKSSNSPGQVAQLVRVVLMRPSCGFDPWSGTYKNQPMNA